jgi:predicted LPLAT superfamily acyltransferase
MVKSGLRLAVNTSPEPVSNIGVSVLEDFSVAGIIALAVAAPWIAAGIAAALLICGVALVVVLAQRIRRARDRWLERSGRPPSGTANYPAAPP